MVFTIPVFVVSPDTLLVTVSFILLSVFDTSNT